MDELKREVIKLIRKGYEGSYWDFKQEYHSNKVDLLHDIICLANNLENRDAYIIFGVNDDGNIVGLDNDEERKNQEHLISLLRDKQFEAGYRPIIELTTIKLNTREIDVLTIKQSNRTPYYLTKSYNDGRKSVKAYHIYSRIQDTNTPKDKSADERVVEELWKRRFGLLPAPIDRLKFALKDKDNWTGKDGVSYYNPSPEFTVEYIQDEHSYRNENKEFYSYKQTNTSTSYENIQCKYHMTVLFECQRVILDSGRYSVATATWGFIPIDKYRRENIVYKYYLKDSLDHDLTNFLYNQENHEETIAKRRYMQLILLYESDVEKEQFENLIKSNINEVVKELNKRKKENLIFENLSEHEKKIENERVHTGKLLKELLEQFRKKNKL